VATIAVSWIGAASADQELLESVRAHAEDTFALPVRSVRLWERPSDTFDARRNQHLSTRILRWLNAVRPGDAHKILGITDADLFIPILTFVYGEAQLDGPAAVVSTARLSSGVPVPNARAVLRSRLIKECIHELGHALGLIHCARSHCVMSRSVNLAHVDAKDDELCHDCRIRYRELRQRESHHDEQGAYADSRR
jgi:archaemetzincin